MYRSIAQFFVVTVLSYGVLGCATTANITPEYVSPTAYQDYDCFRLAKEFDRINTYASNTKNEHQYGLASTGVDIGLHGSRHGIYPTVNIGLGQINNTHQNQSKLSRLYGERDAVIQVARMQGCTFVNGIKAYGEQ